MSETDLTSTEARWRSYQKLIWTQQQIHLQIQQQQQQQYQTQKMMDVDTSSQQDLAAALLQQQQQVSQGQGIPGQMPEGNGKPMEEAAKDTSDPWENFDAHAAFLGPTLWDKRLPYDGSDFKLEYVDLEEFLTENGIPMDSSNGGNAQNGNNRTQPPRDHSTNVPGDLGGNACMGQAPNPINPNENHMMAGPSSRLSPGHTLPQMRNLHQQSNHDSRSPSPSGSASSGISHDIGSDGSPCSNEPGAELALGSVPGHDFDPRTRSFTEDELKPQPMIKKSRKQFVPDDAKDNKYWARRRKNNMAAKRSRDARRVKENQIAMRACFLEKENHALRVEMDRVQKENQRLKDQLRSCRRDH